MKKWLLYAGIFVGSFIIINVASYFFIVKNKAVKEQSLQQPTDDVPADSLNLLSEVAPLPDDSTATSALADSQQTEDDKGLKPEPELVTKTAPETTSVSEDPAAGLYITQEIAKAVEGYEHRIRDLSKNEAELQYEIEELKRQKEDRKTEMEAIWTELSSQFFSDMDKDVQELKRLLAEKEAAKATATEQDITGPKDLAKILEKMKDVSAAPILASLDDDTVIAVLKSLSQRQAGKIMAQMDKARATQISRKMTAKKIDN